MSKVAIVTGGTRGIGYAISSRLIDNGYVVAATYHGNDDAANKAKDKIGCIPCKFDVADYQACHDAVQKISRDLGDIRVLVNNAGITKDGLLHKMSPEDWHTVIETNLSSCFNMCRAVLPMMREHKYGRIINISSINGQKGQFGQANYAAAKAGILGMTKSLALENAIKNITVNAVCPGYIETDMTHAMKQETLDSIISGIPLGRMGSPDEIAAVVGFLASSEASYITGAAIAANGGQYMA